MASRVFVVLFLVHCLVVEQTIAAQLPVAPTDSDYYKKGKFDPELFNLGRNLFFDRVISGNRNIACATCHHPELATGDGLSLSIGEGANGLGAQRDTGQYPDTVSHRIGRNAQPLFNIGAIEFKRMFHDGRVELDTGTGQFQTPAGAELPTGLANILAAQAMFPVVSPDEMAGEDTENDVATAVADGNLTFAWTLLAQRVSAIPEYAADFISAFSDINTPADIRFTHVANALAEFQADAWRADNSPFDQYLRGDQSALSAQQLKGMNLFYGEAECASCHSGAFQTDHQFYAVGIPQVGPGKGNGFDGRADFGREVISGHTSDRFRFRTPSLRNVSLTGPWGHNGAFDSLSSMVAHHLDPKGLAPVIAQQLGPQRPDLDAVDFLFHDNATRRAQLNDRIEKDPVSLSPIQMSALLAFLEALTDKSSIGRAGLVPEHVPSGLTVDR